MTSDSPAHGGRIVLATMATASSDAFRSGVQQGDHLLLVADEVHQIGSPKNSRIMELVAGARLGLSATPKRYGDPDGTAKMMDYFSGVVPPPITLSDAIKSGCLVPYEYYPHPTYLTQSEVDDWCALSVRIRNEIARQKDDEHGRKYLSDAAKMLLIRRSRIAKKATNKVPCLRHSEERIPGWSALAGLLRGFRSACGSHGWPDCRRTVSNCLSFGDVRLTGCDA